MKGRRDEVGELLRGSLLHSTVLETRVLRRGGAWAARAGRKWWLMRTWMARAAAGPRGTPTLSWPDHHSQQSRRLARLRGPHRAPFVSPARAQHRAAWRQRGPRGELLPAGPSQRAGDLDPLQPELCNLLSNSAPSLRERHLDRSRTGVSGVLGSLPVLSRPPLPSGSSPHP